MTVRASIQTNLSEFRGRKLDWTQFLGRLTELLARELTCDRVSIWRLSPTRDQLVCEDLYLAGPRLHGKAEPHSRTQFPNYFWCLEESRTIVASEARTHPGTSCLQDDYLAPQGIHSLLDSAILRKGAVEGLVRCEQVGQPRPWSPSDLLTVRMATILVGSAKL